MNAEIEIVDATTQDAHEIGQIQTQTWLNSYTNSELGITKEDIKVNIKEWGQKGDERIIQQMQKPGARCWVAKNGDKVVGFIAGLKASDENKIEALHVLPEYRGQGIGTRLLETALDWLGNSKKVTLEAVSYNEKAKNFYKKFGFKEQDKKIEGIPMGDGKIIPKILMVRD